MVAEVQPATLTHHILVNKQGCHTTQSPSRQKSRMAIRDVVTKEVKGLLVWVLWPLTLCGNSVQHTRCLYSLCRECSPGKAKLSLNPDPGHLLPALNSGLLRVTKGQANSGFLIMAHMSYDFLSSWPLHFPEESNQYQARPY